jgi:hypothetical protein
LPVTTRISRLFRFNNAENKGKKTAAKILYILSQNDRKLDNKNDKNVTGMENARHGTPSGTGIIEFSNTTRLVWRFRAEGVLPEAL